MSVLEKHAVVKKVKSAVRRIVDQAKEFLAKLQKRLGK